MTKTKVKIPSSEKVCLRVKNEDGNIYFITQNRVTKRFVLYAIIDGKAEKLGTSDSPKTLENKFVFKQSVCEKPV